MKKEITIDQQNFHCSILVPVSTDSAFEAVQSRVPEWWTKNFKGSSQHPGDVFTAPFGETFATMQIVEMEPLQRIVWHVLDCNLHFIKNKKEWKDTKMVWEFTPAGKSTQIDFTHVGLTPEVECFADCKIGWTHYVTQSLFKLLSENSGMPDHPNHSARRRQ